MESLTYNIDGAHITVYPVRHGELAASIHVDGRGKDNTYIQIDRVPEMLERGQSLPYLMAAVITMIVADLAAVPGVEPFLHLPRTLDYFQGREEALRNAWHALFMEPAMPRS